MENLVTINEKELVKYVQGLELEERPALDAELRTRREALNVNDEEEAGYVTAGGIIGFVAGLSAQQKSDVLNSTLLAQLAANKAFNREEQTVEWYGKYHEVLENIGWVINKFDFNKYHGSGSSFEISKVMVEILAAIATENALLVTQAAIDAVKALTGGSKAFAIWDSTTHSSSKGNFLISPCVNDDGNIVMALGCSYFSSNTVDSQFLWFSYSSSSIDLYTGTQTVTLNEDIYKYVRQQIISKLGTKAVDYVANLDI